jgi:eukaryotic-like serine/threonine-protein kinase
MRELEIGDTLDGYRIEALLAHGGMATVFKAVDPESGKPVALKIPHLHYEADVVFFERFRREEEASLRLDHPNVVKALPARGEKSRLYMVMECVDGVPLSSLIAEGRPLPTPQALDLARQTCDALAYLHARGVVHRDVKPGNVLVTSSGQAKLLDLGLAHVETGRKLTIAGLSASVGTPGYMAPEQVRGRSGDARADLYALGTMLYEMLTGRLPYCGEDWEELLRAKRLEPPTPPTAHVPDLDPSLEAIVMKAIEPAPADRYASAVDMLADLRDPSAVPPRPPASRSERPRRRIDPRHVAAGVAILAALCGLGGVGWLSYRRVLETAAEAAAARDAAATHPVHEGAAPARSPAR